MAPVRFRILQPADVEHYQRLRLECLTNYPDFFGDTYEEVKSTRFDKAILSESGHSFLFGAFVGEALVGICGFRQESRTKARHRGNLVQVYVDPFFSGQGIGTGLVHLTISQAFNDPLIDQILLSVVETNGKAIQLYLKIGFIQYGAIENYFRSNDSSWTQLFMVLTRKNYYARMLSKKLTAARPARKNKLTIQHLM